MTERFVIKMVTGMHTIDGAGVHLTRVLGPKTVSEFDPFLMLDSFDSRNPADYIKGFPTHPHRGIETITYLIKGKIEHQDSLGNIGTISAGQGQWMTAGSGILHQEMPLPSDHMLGIQLWLNLPAKQKMSPPAYHDITTKDIPLITSSQGSIRIISGQYQGQTGYSPSHLQASIYDIHILKNQKITFPTKKDETVFIFPITGNTIINETIVPEKTAALLSAGDFIQIKPTADTECRLLCFSAPPLKEPISWGGSIVMNTQTEIQKAYHDLHEGTFISHH